MAGGTGWVGRLVVDAVRAAGHEPVVIARSRGVDVVSGSGLARALGAPAGRVPDLAGPREEDMAETFDAWLAEITADDGRRDVQDDARPDEPQRP